MADPHYTYYVTVADNGLGQNEFFFSGEGSSGAPAQDVNETLIYQNHCVGDTVGKIYKFDQSDSTNAGHPLHFSNELGGTHSGFLDLDDGSGVFHCGTPIQAGASTKVDVTYFYDDINQPAIYPFCPNHANMGGASEFGTDEEGSGPCSDGDYTCCSLQSYFTGQLTGLIHSTNTALSGEYGSFTTLSYDIVTGKETGQFHLCNQMATGTTSGEALFYLTGYLQRELSVSGNCLILNFGNVGEVHTTYNTNNINVSFSANEVIYNGQWWDAASSGFSDVRHYVGYNPRISGNNTGVTFSTSCPSPTDINLNLQRNRVIYDTTGLIASPEYTVRRFITTLNAACTGYETTLEASCLKYYNGREKLGNITFYENTKDAWSGYLDDGSYRLEYVGGSFMTSLGAHTLGSGTINVDQYV